MKKRASGGSTALWRPMIWIGVFLSVFAVLFASCTGVPASVKAERELAEQQAEEAKAAEKAAAKEARKLKRAGQEATPTPEPTPEVTPEPTPEPPPVTLELSADQGQDYVDEFIFLGDSTTADLSETGVLDDSQVWTTESGSFSLASYDSSFILNTEADGTAQSMLVSNAAYLRQPKYLVITLGAEDMSSLSETEFKSQYKALVSCILEKSPNTKIILQSVFPTADGNGRVETVNHWVLSVAEEAGLHYLNTYETLADDTGALLPEYTGEGGHLNTAGAQAVIAYIRTHMYYD